MRKTIVLLMLMSLVGCTQNQRARSFGGKTAIELEKNQKLVNVTWKENNMWILTRQMKESEIPENYRFEEQSSYGILQGTVYISEKK